MPNAAFGELKSALLLFRDEFAQAQAQAQARSQARDDEGDLITAVHRVTPVIEAVAEALIELFERELERLQTGAQLDEVMSLLALRLDDETARRGAAAAARLLYVIQWCSYGEFSDPNPEGETPDVEGDAILLDTGLDAILAKASEKDDEEEDDDED